MRIVLLSINHRTAPVALRERLAVAAEAMPALYADLRRHWPLAEAVVLSTCNRVELYIARPAHEPPTAEALRHWLAERTGVGVDEITAASIQREQEGAVQHLFRVCSGLDSMVLGEPQILGQVKRAYDAAVVAESVGPVLHRVFQQAIAAGKQVRTTTGIDSGRMSVGSVAVDFVRQVFEDFSDKTIVGLGAGEAAKTTLRHLHKLAPHRLWIASRTPARAMAMVESLKLSPPAGGARHWEELDELLVEADVVITSTGAPEPIITAKRFAPLARRRRRRPLFIIDLAVPRDVDPEVGTMTNVYLYNIDDLQSVVAGNLEQRRDEIARCEAHLADAVQACLHDIQHRDLGQLIRQLRARLHELGELEQQRTRRKLASLTTTAPGSEATDDAIDALLAEHTRRLINKILHLPLSQLERREGEPNAPLGFYAAALRRLFDLDDHPSNDGEPTEREDKPATTPSRPAPDEAASLQ